MNDWRMVQRNWRRRDFLLSLVDYVSALVHVKICKIIRICTIGN